MKPILKWAGGKNAIINHIKQYLPSNMEIRNYHEVFFGGGALFFNLEPKKGTVNDINKNLINFYKVIKNHPKQLIDKCTELQKYNINENKYYDFRTKFNEENLDNITHASYFLYFNKTAYNGLYRENSNGKFNVPIGKYKDPKIVNEERILGASKLLKNIKIYCKDFKYIENEAKEGDFCYFDPPYYQSEFKTKFTDYSKEGFTLNDHKRLRDICIKLNEKGVYFILSNSNAKEIVQLYGESGFDIRNVSKTWMISCNASSRKVVNEILIHNNL
jgi:DNA adenine methylase